MSPQDQEQLGRLREILPRVEVKVTQVQAVVEDGGDGGDGGGGGDGGDGADRADGGDGVDGGDEGEEE